MREQGDIFLLLHKYLPMSGEELLLNIGNTDPHLFHKNKVMIQQIGRFIHEAVFVFIHCFNQAFGTFRRVDEAKRNSGGAFRQLIITV